jgi:hypothetical protein
VVLRPGGEPRCGLGLRDRHEIVVGNRIFVFLAQKPLLDQQVDAGRRGVREFPLEQPDRARVLLASEDELGLFFALGYLLPDGHRDGQHDGHDGHAHEQGGHGIAMLPRSAKPPCLTR